MQATIANLSRLVSRSLVTGVVNNKAEAQQAQHSDQNKLVTAVSGFPKQKTGYNIDNILKGQIGDDAYFVARHVDDWDQDSNNTAQEDVLRKGRAAAVKNTTNSPPPLRRNNSADVIGVADGVGGWRQYGVDPGQFSTDLMRNCERLVKAGYYKSNQPASLIAQAFREMQESRHPVIGSSTACVMMFSHEDLKLYTANIGDSGFLVVRDGAVVHRSHEQQHFFNTPFQLSLPPAEMASDVLRDQPEAADRYEFSVEDGDVILLATDGIFDNVPDSLLASEITSHVKQQKPGASEADKDNLATRLQQCANSIALIARQLSQDPDFLSPFAKNAIRNGFQMRGGKEDDITVLLAAVRLEDDATATPA